MKLWKFALIVLLAIFVLSAFVSFTPVGRMASEPLAKVIATIADGLGLFILAYILLFGSPTLAWLVRRGVDKLDKVIEPEKDLTSWQQVVLGLLFAAAALILQPGLATFLIPHSPLRLIADGLGQVTPVVESWNPWWGLWGAFSFLFMYLKWWRNIYRFLKSLSW